MTLRLPVPSDVDPRSLQDLAEDCRAVVRALGRHVAPAVPSAALTGLLAHLPLARLPLSFGALPAEVTEGLLVSVAGYEDYGS